MLQLLQQCPWICLLPQAHGLSKGKGLGCLSPGLAESLLDGLFDGLALGSSLLGTGHCYQHPTAQAQPQSAVWERMGILSVALLGGRSQVLKEKDRGEWAQGGGSLRAQAPVLS